MNVNHRALHRRRLAGPSERAPFSRPVGEPRLGASEKSESLKPTAQRRRACWTPERPVECVVFRFINPCPRIPSGLYSAWCSASCLASGPPLDPPQHIPPRHTLCQMAHGPDLTPTR
ncbi:hypothetical protein AAFF_G00041160 [Aldrovandia affinis]|uniref:Uncharacterized protein n=1 Tax=Aldrovandia affinis TaxID=143900 RepID=A0AAD7S4Q5_9TELE|nr:hypothetical protein AAFF_G00041160 [Aldrovandia affinis]